MTTITAVSAARDPRPGAVHRPGVSLQRGGLRPRHDPERVLRRRLGHGSLLHLRLRAQQLLRPAAARPPLRHGRTHTDDQRAPTSARRRSSPCSASSCSAVRLTTFSFMLLVLATFFLASAGASSAYLTVSEVFPLETRALSISLFFAVGTAAGGIAGPALFGQFVHSGDADLVALGFFIGAAAMALGGVAELLFGVRAEQRSLEAIARPLTAAEADAADRGEPLAAPAPREPMPTGGSAPAPSARGPGTAGDCAGCALAREAGAGTSRRGWSAASARRVAPTRWPTAMATARSRRSAVFSTGAASSTTRSSPGVWAGWGGAPAASTEPSAPPWKRGGSSRSRGGAYRITRAGPPRDGRPGAARERAAKANSADPPRSA